MGLKSRVDATSVSSGLGKGDLAVWTEVEEVASGNPFSVNQ